jgi:hypothetical protein
MNGFKTILIGAAMAIIPAATQYFGTIDWNAVLPAPWGMVVGGVVMIVMRYITTTPIFGK